MENQPAAKTDTLPPLKNNRNLIILISAVIVILVVVIVFLLSQTQNKTENVSNNKTNEPVIPQNNNVNSGSDLKIKNIGINLENYDPSTMKAGDLVFSSEMLGEYDMPFFDFGFQVEASSAGPARKNPQPTFIVPKGTKIYSLVDGVVTDVPKLYSNDYSIHVASSSDSSLIFETEHVINPVVKKGDRVTAGQIIAEASDYDAHNYAGYALVEIGILKGGNPPSHICPFEYLDETIKDDVYAKLRNIYSAWNEFRGEEVYDENLEIPGCMTTEEIPG